MKDLSFNPFISFIFGEMQGLKGMVGRRLYASEFCLRPHILVVIPDPVQRCSKHCKARGPMQLWCPDRCPLAFVAISGGPVSEPNFGYFVPNPSHNTNCPSPRPPSICLGPFGCLGMPPPPPPPPPRPYRHKQAVAWAATKQVKEGDKKVEKALGSACLPCYSFWKDHYKMVPQASTFEDFVSLCESDAKVQAGVDKGLQLVNGGATKSWSDEETTTGACIDIQVKKSVVVLNEAELANLLNMQKVSKAVKDRLSFIDMPSATAPEKIERLFAFADPQRPFRTAEIICSRRVETTTARLQRSGNLWEGEGDAWLAHEAKDVANKVGINGVLAKVANKAIYSTSEFAESIGAKSKKGRGADNDSSKAKKATGGLSDEASGDECSDDDGDDDSAEESQISGVAAAEYKSRVVGCSAGGNADPSPAKQRPPVPLFDESPNPKGAASVRSARTKHSAASGVSSAVSDAFSGRGSSEPPSGCEDDGDDDDELEDDEPMPEFDDSEGIRAPLYPIVGVGIGKRPRIRNLR